MSAFSNLATPAPKVEAPTVERLTGDSERIQVEPAQPSGSAFVTPAANVEPAVTVDDPKKFAPKLEDEVVSHLSVAALREYGSDFESVAGVLSGKPIKNFLRRLLPFFFDERDFVSFSEVKRYVFVKQNFILVYGQETDPSPLYSIPLDKFRVVQENPKKLDPDSVTISPRVVSNEARKNLVTILLKYKDTSKQAYQFTFDTTNNEPVARNFLDVLYKNTSEKKGQVVTATATVVQGSDSAGSGKMTKKTLK